MNVVTRAMMTYLQKTAGDITPNGEAFGIAQPSEHCCHTWIGKIKRHTLSGKIRVLSQSSVVKAYLSLTNKVVYSVFGTLQNCKDIFCQQHIEYYRVMLILPTVDCGSTDRPAGVCFWAEAGFGNFVRCAYEPGR